MAVLFASRLPASGALPYSGYSLQYLCYRLNSALGKLKGLGDESLIKRRPVVRVEKRNKQGAGRSSIVLDRVPP